jgi:hypothetical protein
MIKLVFWSYCRIAVILVIFCCNLNFLDIFSKNTQISNLVQNHPVGAQLFHEHGLTDGYIDGQTDRQTDRQDEDNSRLLNFANAPNQTCGRLLQSVLTLSESWCLYLLFCQMIRKGKISIIIALIGSVT